jgi:hypothetical protein
VDKEANGSKIQVTTQAQEAQETTSKNDAAPESLSKKQDKRTWLGMSQTCWKHVEYQSTYAQHAKNL